MSQYLHRNILQVTTTVVKVKMMIIFDIRQWELILQLGILAVVVLIVIVWKWNYFLVRIFWISPNIYLLTGFTNQTKFRRTIFASLSIIRLFHGRVSAIINHLCSHLNAPPNWLHCSRGQTVFKMKYWGSLYFQYSVFLSYLSLTMQQKQQWEEVN